jgi:hypothetical protein
MAEALTGGGVESSRSYARIVKLSPGRRSLYQSTRVLLLHTTTTTTCSFGIATFIHYCLATLSALSAQVPRISEVGMRPFRVA